MDNSANLIPLSEPRIEGNEIRYVTECLETGWVSSAGKFVDRFEDGVREYCGSADAIAVSSGTAALHTALRVLDIGPGDEVLVPALTFIATANAVRYLGAEPVFLDSDKHLNLDPGCLSEFLKQETYVEDGSVINKSTRRPVKAVIPVHVFGHPADMEPIVEIAREHGLKVVEDATEALGSGYIEGRYSGRRPGVVGDIGCLSFNGNKIMTSGGGGMVLTDNAQWAKRARYLTTQAKDDGLYYIHGDVGYNYRMTNVQAAIGLAQLEQLDGFVQARRNNFMRYLHELRSIPGLSLIEEPSYARSNYWLCSLLVGDDYPLSRDELVDRLNDNNIQARPVWGLLHEQRPFRDNQSYGLKNAPELYSRVLSLPSSAGLSDSDIKRICEVIHAEG